MNTNNTVYCAFTGLGKTYFCQHNLGWIDLDEESWNRSETTHLLPIWVKNYIKYGYKVITGCGGQTLTALKKAGFRIVLILPADTQEAKDAVLKRLEQRGYDFDYAQDMKTSYDAWYAYLRKHRDDLADDVIFVNSNQYLSDILSKVRE